MAAARISGIYEIVNTLDGKRYVGSAVNLRLRRAQHFTRLRKGNHHSRYLQNAWDKHGESAFVFRVVCQCEPAELLAEEQKEIDRKSEYNMTKGAGSCLGRVLSEETKAKISAAHTGRKHSPRSEEHRRNISEAHKGRPRSERTMAALQAARRAYEFTDEDKVARSEGMKRAYAEGKRAREKSAAHRAKIAATLKEMSADPSVRERLREQATKAWDAKSVEERRKHMEMVRAARGPITEEQCRAISERQLGRAMHPNAKLALLAANTGRKDSPEVIAARAARLREWWTPERKAQRAAAMRAYHAKRKSDSE